MPNVPRSPRDAWSGPVVQALANLSCLATGAEQVAVYAVVHRDDDRVRLSLACLENGGGAPADRSAEPTLVDLNQSVAGVAAMVGDLHIDAPGGGSVADGSPRPGRVLAVPVTLADSVVGVIAVRVSDPLRVFDLREVQAIERVAVAIRQLLAGRAAINPSAPTTSPDDALERVRVAATTATTMRPDASPEVNTLLDAVAAVLRRLES